LATIRTLTKVSHAGRTVGHAFVKSGFGARQPSWFTVRARCLNIIAWP